MCDEICPACRELGPPDLEILSVSELSAEWHRLNKWDEADGYANVANEDGSVRDHGLCRSNRMSNIVDALKEVRAASSEEALLKYRITALEESDDGIRPVAFHKIVDTEQRGLSADFSCGHTAELFVSMLKDLHYLNKTVAA